MLKSWFFWLICLLNGPLAAGQAIPYGNNPAAGRYAAVRGIRLYYERYGAGPPLLLLHGNNRSIKSFEKTIPYFAQHYQVIALDSRAQGKSVDHGDSLSFEMMADDGAALLTHLHLDSAYVLGWSDGGITALLLALRHPEKVKKLAATGANLSPDSTALLPALWHEQQRRYQAGRTTVPTDPASKDRWKVFCLDVFQPRVPLPVLGRLRAPCLIIAGDHDVIVPQHTLAIYQHLPYAWLWIVPNSGHATLVEHSADFNQQTDAFFRAPASAFRTP